MRKRKQTKSKRHSELDARSLSMDTKPPATNGRDRQVTARKKAGKMIRGNHHQIKMGDKLYLVTRADISPGYQAVQSCHAIRQFVSEHPDVDSCWFKDSNYLALLSVDDEIELMRLLVSAHDVGLKTSAFHEPDVGGKITAIAIEPHPKTVEICKNLPLALQ
jgi:hypothetical protein